MPRLSSNSSRRKHRRTKVTKGDWTKGLKTVYEIVDIAESNEMRLQAARLLMHTFMDKGGGAWPTMGKAMEEVEECAKDPSICIGLCDDGKMVGWIGLRPMYDKTWELHPLVVETKQQGKGFGRRLLEELELRAKALGLEGIVLGTDDELDKTSLSDKELNGENIFEEIRDIRNKNRHPFEFYRKCGYAIVGVIPNANGLKKPDIWMWKKIG